MQNLKSQEDPKLKFKCERGDIVQINPTHPEVNVAFGACMMVVEEVREWGVQGYVQSLGDRSAVGGVAYYRARWDQIEPTGGKAVWMTTDASELQEPVDDMDEYDA